MSWPLRIATLKKGVVYSAAARALFARMTTQPDAVFKAA